MRQKLPVWNTITSDTEVRRVTIKFDQDPSTCPQAMQKCLSAAENQIINNEVAKLLQKEVIRVLEPEDHTE